jgi:hypothetical protein
MAQSNPTNPIKTIADISTIANYFQTKEIKNKIQEIEYTVSQAAIKEEQQEKYRQIIFHINSFLIKETNIIKDKPVVATALLAINNSIKRLGLQSSSFIQISDKQFFQDTVTLLDSLTKDYQSYESEAKEIESTYRHCKAFSFIADRYPRIKKLLEGLNNFKHNVVFAFLLGAGIPIIIAVLAKSQDQVIDITYIIILLGVSIILGLLATFFPIQTRDTNKMIFMFQMQDLQPYLDLLDVKLDANNILEIFNSSGLNVEILKNKIDKYEKDHPDLLIIKHFFQ